MTTWLDGVKVQNFGTDGGGWTRSPALIVLHSTETGYGGWPSYSGGQSAPHFTIDPQSGEARQHIPLDRAARALKHPSGTPETNRAGAVQVEIIGTCDPANKGKSYLYLPTMTSTHLDRIRALLDKIAAATGIPLRTSVPFEPYPEPSYGSGHPRLGDSAWAGYIGVLGHMHVPDNDHGDPGDINVSQLLGGPSPDPPPAGEAPAFPLPSGHYFGPKSGPDECHSGYYNNDDDKLRPWQARMADRGWTITADGLYGPQTEDVARSFQADKGLAVDGLIGTSTWSTAWTSPVT